MSVFTDCRQSRDRGVRGAVRVNRVRGGVSLACLLALVGLCRMESTAIADDSSTLKKAITWLSEKQDGPTGSVSATASYDPDGLTTERETAEDYKRIAAESAYPPTDPPEKLTSEQLETIAKLAFRCNTEGMRVHPVLVPLFRSMVLRYTGGTYKNAPLHFRLHTPDHYEVGRKYPLVVWLHGAGECGTDNINQLSHLHHIIPWLVGPKKRDFFLLAAQCPHTHVSWEAAEICSTRILPDNSVECHLVDDPVARGNAPLAFTLAMVDAVMKKYPIDAARVSVGGLSTGGDGTWRILERRPDLFAAAAPMVSWQAMRDKPLEENPILKKIPIWAIYSSDDNGIDYARREFQRIKDAGCNANKTEFGVCGHYAFTPAMLQGDVFGWLISRGKDGQRFYVAEPSPTSPEKIGIFADVTVGDLAKRHPTRAARPRPATPEQQPALATPRIVLGKTAVEVPLAPPVQANPRAMTVNGKVVLVSPVETTSRRVVVYSADPSADAAVDRSRMELIDRYVAAGKIKKALAVADKVKNRHKLVECLLKADDDKLKNRRESAGFLMQIDPRQMILQIQEGFSYVDRDLVLDYVDRELDRMERQGATSRMSQRYSPAVESFVRPKIQPPPSNEEPLRPIAAGTKSPKENCGKEWSMSTTTLYGLFANGWDQEADHIPDYIINETGKQLRDRLAKAFAEDDLPAMKEFCGTFTRLDDIPLASPWFDTSGGRLQSRIKYVLNDKAKPVVDLLREIADVKAESKQEFVELARKSLQRIDAITHPKTEQ